MKFVLEKVAPLGRIGLIALATDFNSESDLRRMLPEGMDLFTNRVMNSNPLTLQNLRQASDDIVRAATGILPGFGVDVMIFGCTSGAIAIGQERLQGLIDEACPGIPVTNPVVAAVAALGRLNAKRISMVTPYTPEINLKLRDFFRKQEIEVLSLHGYEMENDIEITKIPQRQIVESAIRHCSKEAEALFISCTALRSSSVIEEIEAEIKIPVITSNQVLIWHVLQLLNYAGSVRGFGTLFTH